MPARILLVDADAFFVAVARLVDPEGAGKTPLLIVGGGPGQRGVVCSASYETRKFGVRSAMPVSRALKLCPGATCVPVPGEACTQKNREISRVLRTYAPVVQSASIDEWYLDLTGTEALYKGRTLADVARAIRERTRAETGIGVSIGGGTNRLIAKLAVEWAKPHRDPAATGVHVVEPGDEGEFLRGFALPDIPFIGPKFRERLEHFGLRTVDDALACDVETLKRWFGDRTARWLFDRIRGIDSSYVPSHDGRKSMSREETFGRDLTTMEDLEEELLRLVVRVTADLRAESLAARTITVRLRDTRFDTRQASRTLPHPVISDRVVFTTARELLRQLRRTKRGPARLIGVALSNLVEGGRDPQYTLFDVPTGDADETSRDRAIATAVDTLRKKFGRKAIVPGALIR
jgi:DNA polymerase IV